MSRAARTNKRKAAEIVDDEVEEGIDQPEAKKTKEQKAGDEEMLAGQSAQEADGSKEPWSQERLVRNSQSL